MHTLFLPMLGFFPKRHETFIKTMSENFQLIVHEDTLWDISGRNIIRTSKIAQEIGDVEKLSEFHTQWEAYRMYVAQKTETALAHKPSAQRLEDHFASIRPVLAESLKRALILSEVHKAYPVDMVVSGADYIHYNRPFTFMASRMNIPSVHIEHGLLGLTPYPRDTNVSPHIRFASNYVILDNDLEVNIFSRYRKQENVRQLLPLGAPLDNSVATTTIDPIDAKQRLGIPTQRKCVLIVLSWNEPTSPAAQIHWQRWEVEFVKSLFDAWQKSPHSSDIQFILKSHPAISDFGQLDGYRNYFTQLASTFGLGSHFTFTHSHLDEAVSASDVVLSWRNSSVMWDAIMRGKPTGIWRGEKKVSSAKDLPKMAVVDAGLCKNLSSVEQVVQLYATMFDKNFSSKMNDRLAEFKSKWNLTPKSVAEKSTRIVNWIRETLSQNTTAHAPRKH